MPIRTTATARVSTNRVTASQDFTAAERTKFKKLYDDKGDDAFKFKKVAVSSLPKAAKAAYDTELKAHNRSGASSEDEKPVVLKGTYLGRVVYQIEHTLDSMGDWKISFWSQTGQLVAKQKSTEYDGASWTH